MRLNDKVAIITGGGSGIGRAIAELFAKEGAKVVVADYKTDPSRATVDAIKQAGGEAFFFKVDVSNPSRVQKMVKATLDVYGEVNILVNAAAILAFGTAPKTNEKTWKRVMAINLDGTFWCCKAVLPHMIKGGGGSIINLSSITGSHDARDNLIAYVTSKGGVTLMTKCMAIDHAKANVRVNAIAPGPTDTPMLRTALSLKQMGETAAAIPMGRMGRPRELAYAALFLASDEASFATGAIFTVDGGQSAAV
jgi:NAD(P)-dependent dehydrogenase (short-subunit alcohol dehydrogenase family)